MTLAKTSLGSGALGVDWDEASREGIDPYLLWADLTHFAYLAGKGQQQQLRMALHCKPNYAISDIGTIAGVQFTPDCGIAARFCSAAVPRDASVLRSLHKYADMLLAEPGMTSPAAQPIDMPALKPGDDLPSPLASRLVIGVVDGLCGFANLKFCRPPDRTRTRLAYFWDQGAEAVGRFWRTPDQGYGRQLDEATLNDLLSRHLLTVPPEDVAARGAAERALYREIGHPAPVAGDWTHGTHVLDLVAGLPAPGAAASDDDVQIQQADVIYVQLPQAALRDTSSHWAAVHVLDALRYIVARAGSHADIVVNLSLGSFGGPHDGSSMIEQAIDQAIADCQGRLKVVVAAGNAYQVIDDGDGSVKPCHARVALDPQGGKAPNASLQWCIGAADLTESFLEIWPPQDPVDSRPAALTVRLAREGAATSIEAGPGEGACLRSNGDVVAAIFNATGDAGGVPNGRGGMVLIALGNTRNLAGTYAEAGTWEVSIDNESSAALSVDAWIERRDVPGELDGSRPQYGFPVLADYVRRDGTLASLANGVNTIVVGAVELDDDKAVTLAPYTSSGAVTRASEAHARAVSRYGPDVSAPGTVTAAGFFSGSTRELAGTSMAAAQVSRRLAAALGSLDASDPLRAADKEQALALIQPPPPSSRRGSAKGYASPVSLPAERAGGFFLPPLPPPRED